MAEISSYKEDILHIFEQDLPWEKLSGTNILVTGATGLIGGCLVDALMLNPQRNYHVYATGRNEGRAMTRFKEYQQDDAFHFIKYDVLEKLDADVHFEYIIHAASNASPNFFATRPVEVIKSNIIGLSNLIEYGMNNDMKRFLYISSGEVYGEGDGRDFSEDYSGYVNCILPRACYPSSKRAAETLCVSYATEYGLDVVIARPCHTYGPFFTEQDNRVYAQFIRNVLRGENIIMKSTGEQFRAWCYVVDCVSALLYILLKGENSQAYNIADSSSNISIRNLADIVANSCGKKVIVEAPDSCEKRGYNLVKKSVFSTTKLECLGWKPRTSIVSGINKTIHTLIDNNMIYEKN